MKKILLFLFIFCTFSLFGLNDSTSHDINLEVNEIVAIDLNNTSTLTLSTIAPVNGGEPITGSTDNSKLLQYTSLVSAGTTRNITANLGLGDTVPAGTSLSLEATNVPANCGSSSGQITLSSIAQSIISNIGSCATGIGINGAELTYILQVDDMLSLIVGDNQTVTITFTLTDMS